MNPDSSAHSCGFDLLSDVPQLSALTLYTHAEIIYGIRWKLNDL